MQFILDTSALSELTKRRPNSGFLAWMERQISADACITTVSVGEIEAGIEILDASQRRTDLEKWLKSLLLEFRDRILPFDVEPARIWGRALAHARRAGLTLPFADAQIAAIAIARDLSVVTRNARHFNLPGYESLRVLNPWT